MCIRNTCWFFKFEDQHASFVPLLYCLSSCTVMLIKIQPDATVCRYLFTAKSLYLFRVSQHPLSGVLKTVTTTSGTGHNSGTATSLLGLIGTGLCESCGHDCNKPVPIRPRWREVAVPVLWPVPEVAVTLQWINICILLQLVGFLLTLNCDARNHEFKLYSDVWSLVEMECWLVQHWIAAVEMFIKTESVTATEHDFCQ